MRFTPSNTYNILADSASKTLQWDVWIKTVATLSASLTAGSWTSVSDYVIGDIPDLSSQVEYELGQFTSNNVTLDMHNISYWKTFFVPTYTDYYECKIQLTLKDGSLIAPDGITAFSGFIDTNSIVYDAYNDKTSFTIRTLLDNANSLGSEEMLTKYVSHNPSSMCANSIAFQNIRGLYLDSTKLYYDPLSYDIRPKEGIHKIVCIAKPYPSGTWGDITVSFDDGDVTYLPDTSPNNSYPIYNADRTQGIILSHNGYSSFSLTSLQEDYFIVLDKDEVLPWQWPINQNEKQLLETLLPKIGVTQINFDELSLSSYDNSRRFSIISNLNSALTSTNNSTKTLAIAANQSNSSIFYGYGSDIYEYSLTASNNRINKRVSLTAGQQVTKLIWDNNWCELWWTFEPITSNTQGYIGYWKRDTNLSATTGQVNAYWYNFEVMDNDLTNYNAIYADATLNKVMTLYPNVIVGNRLTVSAAIAYGTEIILDTFACQRNGNYYFYPTRNVTDYRFSEVYWSDAANRWVSSGQQANLNLIAGTPAINTGMHNGSYNQKDGIVFWDFNYWLWDQSRIYGNQYTVGTVTAITSHTNNIKVGKLYYDPAYYAASKTYYTLTTKNNVSIASITGKNFTNLYGYSATASEYYNGTSVTACGWTSMQSTKNGVYGVDEFGLLFQHSPEIEMYVNKTEFNQMTLFQILQQLLNQYNLVAIFRSDKSVYIYRRSDQGGTPVTTGSTFQIETGDTTQVIQKVKYIPVFDEITISNTKESAVYNGNGFDEIQLGIVKKLDVTSDMLPKNILKDLAYNLYQFYSVQRDMLSIELAGLTKFEYEPFDNCNIDYSDIDINETTTGDGFPIYNITYMQNGNMKLDILI